MKRPHISICLLATALLTLFPMACRGAEQPNDDSKQTASSTERSEKRIPIDLKLTIPVGMNLKNTDGTPWRCEGKATIQSKSHHLSADVTFRSATQDTLFFTGEMDLVDNDRTNGYQIVGTLKGTQNQSIDIETYRFLLESMADRLWNKMGGSKTMTEVDEDSIDWSSDASALKSYLKTMKSSITNILDSVSEDE